MVGAAIGVVQNFRAVGDGVVNTDSGVGFESVAVAVEELEGHDADGPVDSGDAAVVVADGAEDAGDMSAVAVAVHGVAGGDAGDDADAVDVVNVTVAVVINAVVGGFAGVDPHVGGEVRVFVVNAGVNDGDDDVG